MFVTYECPVDVHIWAEALLCVYFGQVNYRVWCVFKAVFLLKTFQKAQEETEKHLKTAELLSLRGDTRGQRDQIVNELLKVHTRFQARIGEYRYLLNMATKFFENLTEVTNLKNLILFIYLEVEDKWNE